MKYPDAGINPAKSGLTARAGLYFNAGLHDKGDGFNLQDLDPYLLFDAETSMLGNLENPTLDLDPATPDTLDVITATRAGIATFTSSDGQIVTADPNTVRVDHVQGEELTPTKFQRVGYTDFSSGWTTAGADVITLNAADGPDGSNTAALIERTTSSTDVTRLALSCETNTAYTASVWLKGATGQEGKTLRLTLVRDNGSANVQNSELTLTSNWQRVTVTWTSLSDNTSVRFEITGGALNRATEFYAWGPQLEEGTSASDFVPNTTGSPKFIASATYGPRVPMMLIEPSATNLVTHSEDFSTGWSTVAVSTVDGQSSPDGSEGATLLKGNTNSSRHNVYKTNLINSVTGSFSLFAKAKELRYLQIASANTTSQYANFDLLSGTIGTIGARFSNVKMEAYPDGWYRITLVSPDYYNSYYISLVSGLNAAWLESWAMPNDTDGLYIWGAQLEEGSVATSYIPTSGSAGVRNADNLVIDGTAFSDFYNQTEGTVYVEAVPQDGVNTSPYYFEFSDGTTANRHHAYRSGQISNFYALNISGTTIFNTSIGSVTLDALNRISYSYKTNDYLGSSNGATPIARTVAVPSGISQLLIGNSTAPTPRLMTGRIKRLLYWPTHSSSL